MRWEFIPVHGVDYLRKHLAGTFQCLGLVSENSPDMKTAKVVDTATAHVPQLRSTDFTTVGRGLVANG